MRDVSIPEISDAELAGYIAFGERLSEIVGSLVLPIFRSMRNADLDTTLSEGQIPQYIIDVVCTELFELIRNKYPQHGIQVKQARPIRGGGGPTWVIDPVDNFATFTSGLPLWGSLISLSNDTGPIFGIMNLPATNERFIGSRICALAKTVRTATHIKTRRDPIRPVVTLRKTRVGLTANDSELSVIKRVGKTATLLYADRGCYCYCLLAHGLIDLIIESDMVPFHHVQALQPIIEKAGGVISNWNGQSPLKGGQIVAAGDPYVHECAIAFLNDGKS